MINIITTDHGDGTGTRTTYEDGLDPVVEAIELPLPSPVSPLEILAEMDPSAAAVIVGTSAENLGQAIGMAVAITQPDKVVALQDARDNQDADAGVAALADSVEIATSNLNVEEE